MPCVLIVWFLELRVVKIKSDAGKKICVGQ